jgi:hypothetical protein
MELGNFVHCHPNPYVIFWQDVIFWQAATRPLGAHEAEHPGGSAAFGRRQTLDNAYGFIHRLHGRGGRINRGTFETRPTS